jgi:ABC-type lipoprotein release transport system permease subunit
VNLRTLILRSLRFHWRNHLGVLLGALVGSAALIGALIVGDSVRGSLREMALQRLGWVDAAMAPADRFFTQELGRKLNPVDLSVSPLNPTGTVEQPSAHVVALLKLPGTATRQDGTARANLVNVLGVPGDFWDSSAVRSQSGRAALPRSPDPSSAVNQPRAVTAAQQRRPTIPKGAVVLNEALAQQLRARPGEEIVLRVHKPTALSRDVPITPQSDASIALRLKVHAIAAAEQMGSFSLQANQAPPLNAFLNRDDLAEAAGLKGKANVTLAGQFWNWGWHSLPWFQSRWSFALASPFQVADNLSDRISSEMSLSDISIETRTILEQGTVEIRSDRIFLEPAFVTANLNWSSNGPLRQPEFKSSPVVDPVTGLPAADPDFTNPRPILTYLVNQLRARERTAPYSMVTAAGPPWTPPGLRDDEIIVNQWLADDLQLKPGDTLDFTYFLAESGARLVERTNRFRVRAIVPLTGVYADRTLMPEFPGLAKAESTHDWDAGFPLVHKIRDEDEKYWKDYRGTPKAFVTLPAGQAMWGNRFGNLTAIRFPIPTNEVERGGLVAPAGSVGEGGAVGTPRPNDAAEAFRTRLERILLLNIDPASLGLRFDPVRAHALAASSQSQDFGGLFLGFSFFLILAALILMALLFQFGLEQRTTEIGTLLALGFPPKRVRRLLLVEGALVAFVGGGIGVVGGIAYAKLMLRGLTTIWRDAVGTSALQFHVTPPTLIMGLCASVVVCVVTVWFALRKEARRPARELLSEGAETEAQSSKFRIQNSRRSSWLALGSGAVALLLIAWALWNRDGASPATFFGAGSLLLVAGLAATAALLTALDRAQAGHRLTLTGMGVRGCTRRRRRSLASVALLACGSFMVVAVGANRLDAGRDAAERSSGTGGFALFAQSTLPVVRDLNTKSGQEFYNLDVNATTGVNVVPFRVRDGDDASCLNLNRAQSPRLLGVKPELLAERKAFTFAKVLKGSPSENPWLLLKSDGSADSHVRLPEGPSSRGLGGPRSEDDTIPAIGDAASIQWALGKKIGDTLTYTDERGQQFKIRLVAAVANSILQGSLLIDEAEFVKRFPSESGYRMFLIDIPSNTPAELERVSGELTRALQDVGLEATPAASRLAAFNAVQNTYLNTFQVLGGLGLLLGSAGLGAVVLRNVLERRSELALLQAVGFRRRALRWLVLSEHGGLLALGLAVGMLAALAAILPVLLSPGANVHALALSATLAGVFVSGVIWTRVATSFALRGSLLNTLRNE